MEYEQEILCSGFAGDCARRRAVVACSLCLAAGSFLRAEVVAGRRAAGGV
jgi:hypothetical protein